MIRHYASKIRQNSRIDSDHIENTTDEETGISKAAPRLFAQFKPVVQMKPAHHHALQKKSTGDEWERFAESFNDQFKSVLHIFDGQEAVMPEGNQMLDKGTRSGRHLTGVELRRFFTETQRQKLSSFMVTGEIPDRLFNGDDIGGATAQQRLLVSAHILATGKYKPGSFDQRVHARMCWHWVHITHHYAGVTTTGLNTGVMGTFDHNNNIMFGAGNTQSLFHGKGVRPEDLPEVYDADNNIGPIPENTDHRSAAESEQARRAENPELRSSIKMLHTLPFDQIDTIQPGDWLWYYNANGSGIGSHSVIFSRWASNEQTIDGVKYKKAICFSQGTPDSGGREHTAYLGERFHKSGNIQISPVNYIARMDADNHPPRTVEEFLPMSKKAVEDRLTANNEKFINRYEQAFKPMPGDQTKKIGRFVDRQALKNKLRQENNNLIDGIKHHLTEGQIELLNTANGTEHLETLIRLTEKLKGYFANTILLDAEQEKADDPKKLAARNELLAQIEVLTTEKTTIDKNIEEWSQSIIDTESHKTRLKELKDLKNKALSQATKDRQFKMRMEAKINKSKSLSAKEQTRYNQIVEQYNDIDTFIEMCKTDRTLSTSELKQIETYLQQLKKDKTKAGYTSANKQKKIDELTKKLPYIMVHPGGRRGEVKGRVTGKLESVITVPELKALLKDEILPNDLPPPRQRR